MEKWFEGKVAVVTGAGSGIGRATAIEFARKGAKVVVSDVIEDGGDETVRVIKDISDGLFIQCDVSKVTDVQKMIRATTDLYGRLDCAFNNAGVSNGMPKFAVEHTEEEWDRIININLKGVWLCMKYEIPEMLKQGKGAIVNTSSVAGLVGAPGRSAYTASKHGVVGVTKVVALEYAKAGIRANAVCPGGIHTPMLDPLLSNEEYADSLIKRMPLMRFGNPEEVAAAAVWLCSDLASFITGVALPVDAGAVAL